MGRAMLSKSLIQFSVDGQGSIPSLFFDLRPNYGEGNEDNGDFLQWVPCTHCHTQCLQPCTSPCQPMPLPETLRHSRASLAQSLVGSLLLSPGSWCTPSFVCALQVSVSPVLWKFWNQIPLAFKVTFPGASQSLCLIPRHLLWALELLQQCKDFFNIILSSLWVVCSVALWGG